MSKEGNMDISDWIDLFWDLKHQVPGRICDKTLQGLVKNLILFKKLQLDFKKMKRIKILVVQIPHSCFSDVIFEKVELQYTNVDVCAMIKLRSIDLLRLQVRDNFPEDITSRIAPDERIDRLGEI